MRRLPPRRERPRLNLREPLQREWPRHRRFVRSFGCSVPLCTTNTPIEFAHLRSAANAGTALKPHDAFGVSLCGADRRAVSRAITPNTTASGTAAFSRNIRRTSMPSPPSSCAPARIGRCAPP